jgi:hypothetical protein
MTGSCFTGGRRVICGRLGGKGGNSYWPELDAGCTNPVPAEVMSLLDDGGGPADHDEDPAEKVAEPALFLASGDGGCAKAETTKLSGGSGGKPDAIVDDEPPDAWCTCGDNDGALPKTGPFVRFGVREGDEDDGRACWCCCCWCDEDGGLL